MAHDRVRGDEGAGSPNSGRPGWSLVAGVVLATASGSPAVRAQTPAAQPATVAVAPAPVAVTPDRLVRLGAGDLERLYRSATPGTLPRGRVHGIPIVAPGRSFAPAASRAGRLVWQGKIFDPDSNAAVNRFFGVRAVRGNLSYGPSWLDGQPALILDYQGTSLVYARYRDEIREVAPGLYLGVMFARTEPQPTFTRFFAFEARP